MNSKPKLFFLPVAFLLPLLLMFTLTYYNKTLSRLQFAGLGISRLTYEQLTDTLSARIRQFEDSPVVIEITNNNNQPTDVINTNLKSLGITFDKEATANVIYNIGKSGDLTNDLTSKFESFFVSKNILPIYYFDSSKFSTTLDELLAPWEINTQNASIKTDGAVQIIPEVSGEVVDRVLFLNDLRDRINNLQTGSIVVHLTRKEPLITAIQAQKALERVKILGNQKIVLSWEYDSWSLGANNLTKILKFYPQSREDGFVYRASSGSTSFKVLNIKWSGREPPELEVGIEKQALNEFVGTIAEYINQETVDATIIFEGDRISKFTPAVDGRKLNEEVVKQAILDQLSINSINFDKIISLNLPVFVTRAKINNDEVNSLGISELIGSGVSYFAGSIANRIFNLSLGAKRISGTIVKPSENFSFNKTVGEVSSTSGYKPAYVISEGRTVLDDGGGICQVSTTLFRAALNSGLPIISRTAHAYRVGYYEQHGFKPGLDATVWAPAVDLIFKNDTGNHILIQTIVDLAAAKLEVDIYGTRDGRSVEISQPVVSDIKSAPESRYQDDPSLPRGEIKQVDFSADGGTSVFRRKVLRNEEILIQDTFKSIYRPWQAVYLVGTGD